MRAREIPPTRQPDKFGASVFGLDDVYDKLKEFRAQVGPGASGSDPKPVMHAYV